MLARTFILRTSALRPVERMVRHSRLFRGIVRRFIAGETLEEAIKVTEDLTARGFLITLDHLGENTKSIEEATLARETSIRMLEALAKSGRASSANISIKLTQWGLDQGDHVAENNYRQVLEAAKTHENFVRVDMEGSAYTERTIQMLERVWPDYRNTGTVLQSYLRRTAKDVETMISLGARTRLVKGAYLEPEAVAYQEKKCVDENYLDCAKRLMEQGNYPALATHDEKIIAALKAYAIEKGIGKERFEFQMLFGIRRDIQERLKEEGFHVRVYVPFGESWYPYFTRRLAERPANVWFVLKSLVKR